MGKHHSASSSRRLHSDLVNSTPPPRSVSPWHWFTAVRWSPLDLTISQPAPGGKLRGARWSHALFAC
eukprot:15453175-Alexandrium_andersonii.AAC.1